MERSRITDAQLPASSWSMSQGPGQPVDVQQQYGEHEDLMRSRKVPGVCVCVCVIVVSSHQSVTASQLEAPTEISDLRPDARSTRLHAVDLALRG